MRIVIVGAGIGGLSAARMAARAGHEVVVAEQAPRVRAVGAGILLDEGALALLAATGFDLEGIGRPLASMAITTASGARRGVVRGRWSFAREELMAALVRGVEPVARIRTSAPVQEVVDDGDRVRCTIAGREETADVVIGADGLMSTVRSRVDPSARIRETGQVCWRGIVEMDAGAEGTELWTGLERVGVVPLPEGRTYVYVVRARVADDEGLRAAGVLPERERRAASLLAHLPAERILRHDLRELDRPTWGRGRVLLLGDAAHALTPNLGLGAALAVGDAAALVEALGDPSTASRRYRRRRHALVRSTQLLSRRLGRIAHDATAFSRLVRAAAGLDGAG